MKTPHKRCLKGKKHKTKGLTRPGLREMQTKPQRHTIPPVTATAHVQKRVSTECWARAAALGNPGSLLSSDHGSPGGCKRTRLSRQQLWIFYQRGRRVPHHLQYSPERNKTIPPGEDVSANIRTNTGGDQRSGRHTRCDVTWR